MRRHGSHPGDVHLVVIVALALVLALVVAPAELGATPSSSASLTGTSPSGAVFVGDHADPDVIRAADGRFLSYGTTTFGPAGRVAVPLLVSDDLRAWTSLGDALPVAGSWTTIDPVWAPSVTAIGAVYVMYYSAVRRDGVQRCVGRAVAPTPNGPFVDTAGAPLLCPTGRDYEVIDPSVYVELDGTPYLSYKTSSRVGTSIQTRILVNRLTRDGLSTDGPPVVLLAPTQAWEEGGVENPEMVSVGGRHWLFYSAGWWDTDRYATAIARCDGPAGPCRAPTRLLVTNALLRGPGGASLVQGTTVDWWIVYHAWEGSTRVMHADALSFGSDVPQVVPVWKSPRETPPYGSFENVVASDGAVRARGWAADPDSPDPVGIVVTVDAVQATVTSTRIDRPDLALPASSGPIRGFDLTVAVGPGRHAICATAVNDGAGPDTTLGCRSITVTSTRRANASTTWWDQATSSASERDARAVLSAPLPAVR